MIPDASARQRALDALKRLGPTTINDIALHLGITHEAARQQVNQLEADGMITGVADPAGTSGGRPARRFRLTRAGEHAFPKRYGDLAGLLLDVVGRQHGPEAVREVIAAAVDAKVDAWKPVLAGRRSLRSRLDALRSIYAEDDPWVEITEEDGSAVLVERNCPYLDVAAERPELCSMTVHTLSRLLGRRVERVRRFQNGHGMCAFVVRDEPVPADAPLRLESDPP